MMMIRDEDARRILRMYLQDENNILDEQGRYKTYRQISLDLRGLIKPWTIKRVLREEYPDIHKNMMTKHKGHQCSYYQSK